MLRFRFSVAGNAVKLKILPKAVGFRILLIYVRGAETIKEHGKRQKKELSNLGDLVCLLRGFHIVGKGGL